MYWMQTLFIIDDAIQKVKENNIQALLSSLYAKELVPLKQVVKLRRDLSANDTSRHPKLLKIGPNHQCQ